MNGAFHHVKVGLGEYLTKWKEFLVADTPGLQAYAARPLAESIIFVPGRLVDAAEEMLAAYRRNDNPGESGHKSKLPVVLIGLSKDYTPTDPSWNRQLGDRMLIKIEDDTTEAPASIYGYRQAAGDVRAQVVIVAADEPTARSMTIQFCLFIGAVGNRTFYAAHTWGQYEIPMGTMLETPDVPFMEIATDQKNLTMLAGDLNLRVVIPYFDAPAEGEPNDGTANNPPGYPYVTEVQTINNVARTTGTTTDAGTIFTPTV
jgi:hypothetical protein